MLGRQRRYRRPSRRSLIGDLYFGIKRGACVGVGRTSVGPPELATLVPHPAASATTRMSAIAVRVQRTTTDSRRIHAKAAATAMATYPSGGTVSRSAAATPSDTTRKS